MQEAVPFFMAAASAMPAAVLYSAAATLAVDFLAQQRTAGRAQDRAGRPVAMGVDRAADQRAAYATDDQALEAFFRLSKLEGIIPALESSHAVAEVIVRAPQMSKDQIIICNLSGRGDKDVQQVAEKVEM